MRRKKRTLIDKNTIKKLGLILFAGALSTILFGDNGPQEQTQASLQDLNKHMKANIIFSVPQDKH